MHQSFIRNLAWLAASGCIPMSAQAVTIANSDLPGTLQSCAASGTCFVVPTSTYESASASAFSLFDLSGPGFTQNTLIRYTLTAPSGETAQSTNLYAEPPLTTSWSTAYTGYLWMQVQDNYSAAETAHPVTLYLDKITPVPQGLFGQSGDLSLTVSGADLLSGGSSATFGLDYNNQGYSSGSLGGEVPVPCVAQGCSVSAQLNLVQLHFGSFGPAGIQLLGFDPTDTRGLVYRQGFYDDGSTSGYAVNDTQSFNISAVPEPRSNWMLAAGLACLAAAVRRKEPSTR